MNLGALAQTPSPSPVSSGATGAHLAEIALAALLAVGGIRSLIRWMGARFDATSSSERVLYTLYRTARVGMWFAFGGFFAGYAVVEDPGQFRWYVFVPIGLAGIQLLTGVLLGRSPPPTGPAPQA